MTAKVGHDPQSANPVGGAPKRGLWRVRRGVMAGKEGQRVISVERAGAVAHDEQTP
jgi:hypothetical protein